MKERIERIDIMIYNTKKIAEEVAKINDLPFSTVNGIVEDVFEVMGILLSTGISITIAHFGKFYFINNKGGVRKFHIYYKNIDYEKEIPPHSVLCFAASKPIKDQIKENSTKTLFPARENRSRKNVEV